MARLGEGSPSRPGTDPRLAWGLLAADGTTQSTVRAKVEKRAARSTPIDSNFNSGFVFPQNRSAVAAPLGFS